MPEVVVIGALKARPEKVDEAELDAHLQSAHLAALVEPVDELFTEPPVIIVYDALPQGEPAKGALAQ